MDLSADGTGAIPTDAVNEVPIQTQSEEIRIATAVAHAVTVTETQVDENLDLSTINADTTGLVPAEIKRGDKTIKGLAPGSVVKGYRIEKILGVGGMGQGVQRAADQHEPPRRLQDFYSSACKKPRVS